MYKKGTVVLVPFPFTDLTGNKVRPAAIISDGKIGSDVVVVFVTSQAKLKGKYIVAIDPSDTSGIKVRSQIICHKIATLDTKIILGEIGTLSRKECAALDEKLRSVLGL